MYPVMVEKVNCLESLVGVRTECAPTVKPFYVEDIEGWDTRRLASLARASEFKGVELAKWIINSAAREMLGDIELLMNNGYSFKSIVGDRCSNCQLLPTYTAGGGIVIKSAVASNFQKLLITRLEILTNVTGTRTLILDDGITQTEYEVSLSAGVVMPCNLEYETTAKKVRVFFQDATVGMGQVLCATTSSCGCGSVAANPPFVVAGLLNGVETVTQYGFLPCATVTCSYDSLVCGLIKATPNIFGLAMLYKIGDKFLVTKSQSERNNEVASFNDGNEEELQRNFGQLYWAKMKGARGGKGIAHIINDYMKRAANDRCVICESKVYSASVTG